jgi:2-(1,2-epoxy-1,2-dihydrophenyl)acetyl-CoA isomerase
VKVSKRLRDRVRWDLDKGVARITMARPEAGNALDMAMAEGLREAADRVERGVVDGSVRVAVLAADGKTFCVGGDLREFAGAEQRDVQVAAVADELHRAILVLRRAPVPVVSVVHGTVAGGGIGIALAADVVLVAEEAKIRLAYTAAGLSPDCGSTWVLTHRLGPARVLDLTLTNRLLTGREAADCGLVSRAVPADELATVAEQVVEGLRAGAASAFAETERLVESARSRTLAEQLDEESATIARLIAGPDGREGVDAFLAERPAVFERSTA